MKCFELSTRDREAESDLEIFFVCAFLFLFF